MNRKLPTFMPTPLFTAIYQRAALFIYLLLFSVLVIFANPAKAIDYEFPELVITGKQSHYSPNPAATKPIKSNPYSSKNRTKSSKKIETDATQKRTSITRMVADQQPTLAQNNQRYTSSSPIARKVEYRHPADSHPVSAEPLVSPMDHIHAPLRLRKHLAVRSSKSQFMRMCLINECFSGKGQQNFLVR